MLTESLWCLHADDMIMGLSKKRMIRCREGKHPNIDDFSDQ